MMADLSLFIVLGILKKERHVGILGFATSRISAAEKAAEKRVCESRTYDETRVIRISDNLGPDINLWLAGLGLTDIQRGDVIRKIGRAVCDVLQQPAS